MRLVATEKKTGEGRVKLSGRPWVIIGKCGGEGARKGANPNRCTPLVNSGAETRTKFTPEQAQVVLASLQFHACTTRVHPSKPGRSRAGCFSHSRRSCPAATRQRQRQCFAQTYKSQSPFMENPVAGSAWLHCRLVYACGQDPGTIRDQEESCRINPASRARPVAGPGASCGCAA